MRRFLLCILCLFGIVPTTNAALQFDGSTQCAYSTSTIDLTAASPRQASVSMWLWWNSFTDNDNQAIETGAGGAAKSISIDPDGSNNSAVNIYFQSSTSDYVIRYFTRPSAGAWHHFVFLFDGESTGAAAVDAWMDGSHLTLNTGNATNATTDLGNLTWNFMGRNCNGTPSLWGAGRLAEVAIWNQILLNSTDIGNLYNGGVGNAANTVQAGSIIHYWPLCGTNSPEIDLAGSITLTLLNTPLPVAHPVTGGCSNPSNIRRRLINR